MVADIELNDLVEFDRSNGKEKLLNILIVA